MIDMKRVIREAVKVTMKLHEQPSSSTSEIQQSVQPYYEEASKCNSVPCFFIFCSSTKIGSYSLFKFLIINLVC